VAVIHLTFSFVCRETFLRDTTNDAQDSPMEGVDIAPVKLMIHTWWTIFTQIRGKVDGGIGSETVYVTGI